METVPGVEDRSEVPGPGTRRDQSHLRTLVGRLDAMAPDRPYGQLPVTHDVTTTAYNTCAWLAPGVLAMHRLNEKVRNEGDEELAGGRPPDRIKGRAAQARSPPGPWASRRVRLAVGRGVFHHALGELVWSFGMRERLAMPSV
jgi:hypothetical protein